MSTDQPGKIVRSPSWRIIYTNVIALVFGDNDVRLTCGFDQDLTKPGSDVFEEALVVMTPRSAKLLSHTLNAVIANFEAVSGPIPIAADRIQKIEESIVSQTAELRKKQADSK